MSAPSRGIPGGSAAEESGRRRRRRQARRVLAVALGGAAAVAAARAGAAVETLLAIAAVAVVVVAWPSRVGRWAAGAAGERATARALEGVGREGYSVLHDVRLLEKRWNLDHVLLGPAGVVVVESKQWRKPVRVRRRWPKVVEERVGWQIDAVADALRRHGHRDTTVHGFVCVHGAKVRRRWWTGARNAPIGDADHLRRWLRRLPHAPTPPDELVRKVFKDQH